MSALHEEGPGVCHTGRVRLRAHSMGRLWVPVQAVWVGSVPHHQELGTAGYPSPPGWTACVSRHLILPLSHIPAGNKGAVGVSFMFNGTSFGFVNCHLTSGNEKTAR